MKWAYDPVAATSTLRLLAFSMVMKVSTERQYIHQWLFRNDKRRVRLRLRKCFCDLASEELFKIRSLQQAHPDVGNGFHPRATQMQNCLSTFIHPIRYSANLRYRSGADCDIRKQVLYSSRFDLQLSLPDSKYSDGFTAITDKATQVSSQLPRMILSFITNDLAEHWFPD